LKLKSNILDYLKGNRIKLRKYPEVVAAMFKGEEIPEDLRPEKNTHKSAVLSEYEEHLRRRSSMTAPIVDSQDSIFVEDEVQPIEDFEQDQVIEEVNYERSAFEEEEEV